MAYHTMVPEADSVIPLHSLLDVLAVHSDWGILQEGHFFPLVVKDNLLDLVHQALTDLCRQIIAHLHPVLMVEEDTATVLAD